MMKMPSSSLHRGKAVELTGIVSDGVVKFEEPCPVPNGTKVTVRVKERASAGVISSALTDCLQQCREEAAALVAAGGVPPTPLAERLRDFIEHAGELDLPADAATNVDHYLYGAPKKS